MIRSQRIDGSVRAGDKVRHSYAAWQSSVARMKHVDAITTELVRVRCAQHHDCHT
jgi:hypothetical protein